MFKRRKSDQQEDPALLDHWGGSSKSGLRRYAGGQKLPHRLSQLPSSPTGAIYDHRNCVCVINIHVNIFTICANADKYGNFALLTFNETAIIQVMKIV